MTDHTQERITCPHCKGKKTFTTKAQHPRGAGHKVNCSRCRGVGVVPRKGRQWEEATDA